MPLAKCPRCNQLFTKSEEVVCARCEPAERADYEMVREALQKVPHLNAEEVAEETGVARDCVLRMIDQGLIQNVSVNKTVRCGRCGKPAISVSKRLCQACLEKLNAQLAVERASVKLPPEKQADVAEMKSSVRQILDAKRKSPEES